MQRHGIINLSTNATLGQRRAQRVAMAHSNDILVVNVPRAGCGDSRRGNVVSFSAARESGVVKRCIALARRSPGFKMRKFDVEHGSLNLVEAKIAADDTVVVLRFAAMHSKDFQALGEHRIVRHTHARIAKRAQILGRKKRQTANVAAAASRPAG